jgi:hypothetical protein
MLAWGTKPAAYEASFRLTGGVEPLKEFVGVAVEMTESDFEAKYVRAIAWRNPLASRLENCVAGGYRSVVQKH